MPHVRDTFSILAFPLASEARLKAIPPAAPGAEEHDYAALCAETHDRVQRQSPRRVFSPGSADHDADADLDHLRALSLSHTAELLDCDPATITRYIRRGILTPVIIGGVQRIRVSDIEALIAPPPKELRVPQRKRGRRAT